MSQQQIIDYLNQIFSKNLISLAFSSPIIIAGGIVAAVLKWELFFGYVCLLAGFSVGWVFGLGAAYICVKYKSENVDIDIEI